jgi:hypothetical protein
MRTLMIQAGGALALSSSVPSCVIAVFPHSGLGVLMCPECLQDPATGQPMTRERLVGELGIFFLASFETTSHAVGQTGSPVCGVVGMGNPYSLLYAGSWAGCSWSWRRTPKSKPKSKRSFGRRACFPDPSSGKTSPAWPFSMMYVLFVARPARA